MISACLFFFKLEVTPKKNYSCFQNWIIIKAVFCNDPVMIQCTKPGYKVTFEWGLLDVDTRNAETKQFSVHQN